MSEYRWLTADSQKFMGREYLAEGETVDARVKAIAAQAEKILGIKGFADKFVSYMKKGWFSLSTPVWTNFGTGRGSPISCFGSYIEDNMDSILYAAAEVGKMSKVGGGTSGYFGNLRPRGAPITNNGHSSGPVHFMQLFESAVNVVSQGSARRGSFAAYLPVEHPDVLEFLKLRSEGNPIKDLSFGVTISDEWMEAMTSGDMAKKHIWAKILEARTNKGYPYIIFSGNANKYAPDVYKDKDMKITQSNLCVEIMLSNNEDESFVCCLSSMNLRYYDEWKNTDAPEVLVYFLDAVMTEFIDKSADSKFMERARNFAKNQRAIGVGVLGWHSYLQSKLVAFDSPEAFRLTDEIFAYLQEATLNASRKMAIEYGEPPLLKGYGRRHTTLMAVAPTKSSSFILGQASEGIEPRRSNYYIEEKAKGKFTVRSPELTALLEEKGQNTEEVWESILRRAGSVQHLDFLSDEEKAVFKTFIEIDPTAIVMQAAVRQAYIDQGQSLNVMIHPQTPVKQISQLYIEAWRQGVKSLYYQLGVNAAQEFSRSLMSCAGCEA